jgi:hypothetical protein
METVKFIKESNEKDLSILRSKLYKKGILASFDTDGRIILYTSKNQRFNKLDNISIECNGLIFDTNTMKPLVVPMLNYISNISNISTINNYINNDLYDIYHINDGTIINLYWWEPTNSWVISTTRGYDLTDEKWSDLTYLEILKDILCKNNHTIDDFYKLLDKKQSYTFGFKHPSMHPFYEGTGEPIYLMWFVQSVHLDTFKINTNFDNEINIKLQERLESKVDDIKVIFKIISNSYNDYKYNKFINYGYIFKSKDVSKTTEFSSLLFESSLMKKIRTLYYNSSLNNAIKENGYDRETYIVIYSYLNVTIHYLFKEMFPQHTKKYARLENIAFNIVKDIILYVKDKNTQPKYECTKNIYNALNNKFTLNIDNTLCKTITDFIINDEWLHVFYTVYTSNYVQ